MSSVKCVTHTWPDGVCRHCGAIDERKRLFARATAERAERFSRMSIRGMVFGAGREPKP